MGQPSDEILLSIAETAADTLDMRIEELPPLSQSVNLDAVDSLLADDTSNDVTVMFPYAGHQVLVHSDNTVYICPIQERDVDGAERSRT